jgi:hypothetical protein
LETDTIVEIETNLDDLSPELTGAAMEKLLALGALVLCALALEAQVVHALLSETSAFGVRRSEKRRYKLERCFEKVQTVFGEISLKLGLLKGEVVQVAPEFESCRAASERAGQPLRIIYQAALAAYPKA